MTELVDVFPSKYSCRTTRLKEVNTDKMRSKSTPFVCDLSGRQIIFKPVPSDPSTNDHFKYALKEASSTPSQTVEGVHWDKMNQRLKREDREKPLERKGRGKKGNTDVTLAYKYRNVFLTKRYFTFGIRRTGTGDCHVYHTKDTPILFYLPKFDVREEDKTFPASNPFDYKAFILERKKSYLVSENTTYLIVTTNKSLFAVDKILASDIDGSMPFKDPTEQPFIKHDFVHSMKRKLDAYLGDEHEESSANQNPQSKSYVTDERIAECPQTSDSNSTDYDRQPPASMREVNLYVDRSESMSSSSSSESTLNDPRDSPQHFSPPRFNCSTPKKPDVSSNKSPTDDGKPLPFRRQDDAGNTFLYTPIDMKWSANEPLSLNVHPFMVQTNGKVFTYVPIKE